MMNYRTTTNAIYNGDVHESNYNGSDGRKVLRKRESMQSEKQISVDPISLRDDSTDMHPPKSPLHNLLLPPKGKFSSSSFSSSTSSSPRFEPKHKKKSKNHHGGLVSPLARQHSVALSNLERLRSNHLARSESQLSRSKSCGEGRASQPSVDFELWSNTKTSTHQKKDDVERKPREGKLPSFNKKESNVGGSYDDTFKCGALCLFIPAFGKGKPVKSKKDMEEGPTMVGLGDLVSHRASLEKFECGSWRSSAVINHEEDGDATSNMFFDLPMELMRASTVNDTESPITTAFLFDNNKDFTHQPKGVLKTNATTTTTNVSVVQPRRSPESPTSSRHVRFSTSSPSLRPTSPGSNCVTPRLRKARDEFNAFLEAQSA